MTIVSHGTQEVVDGFTLDAFWDEVDRRPQMDAPLTADEAAELDAYIESDPHYVMFQLSGDFYASVECAENRPDYVGV